MSDALLVELRLALGKAGRLGEEIPSSGPYRLFTVKSGNEPEGTPSERVVVLHSREPEGPSAGAMLDRMASIRAINHPSILPPLAVGAVADRTWVVEGRPLLPPLAWYVRDSGPLAIGEAVTMLRNMARALATMHRHNLCHGALKPEVVFIREEVSRLGGMSLASTGSAEDDLHQLGRVGWFALTGTRHAPGERSTRVIRPQVPPALDRVVAQLLDQEKRTFASAEAVLEALDHVPVRAHSPLATLVDGAERGARSPDLQRHLTVLAIVSAVALFLLWLVERL